MTIEEQKLVLLEADIQKLEVVLENYNIKEIDNSGNNILHYYIKQSKSLNLNYKSVIDLFVKAGLDIDEKQQKGAYQRSPLHLAVFMKLKDITDYLIGLGADVNSTDANGNTVLFTAVMSYRGDDGYFIEKLIQSGADIHKTNAHGISPVELAESIANYDARKYFER
ncbi:ankyrin repeat domain-containing protein [Dysgonomonas sp. 521]|uniref:ankyrin repeat domain-containing protein n=1 Tax=Dysgonomonas sp. 521 TaxID=2302932 RepID=UPI0013CFEFC6|nr:ankyrin repeat domain-containing protein [Dysgonomonas sp. 521]